MIGTVLVLFIVILAMGGILAWGVPAIQGLQEHAEFQSVLTQMHQVDANLLVLRDPQTTARAIVSMNKGILRVEDGSRWIITAAADPAYTGVTYTEWEDDDGLWVSGLPAGPTTVTVDRAIGGTFTRLVVPAAVCGISCNTNLAADQLDDRVTRVQMKVGSLLKAESWIFDAGRLSYKMQGENAFHQVHIEMGAIFAQQGDRVFLEQRASVKEPVFDVTPKDISYLVRVFQLDGSTGAVGKGRPTVLANLIDNYGTTRGRPFISPAYSVRIQIDDTGATNTRGPVEEGFCNHFLSLPYYTTPTACNGGSAEVLYDPPDLPATNDGVMSFELNQALVRTIVTPV